MSLFWCFLFFLFIFCLQKGQSTTTVTAIASIPSDNKVFVNGKELTSDQPVKVSKIEVIENKMSINANQASDVKTPTSVVAEQKSAEKPQLQTPVTAPTPTPTPAQTDISATPTKPAQKDSAKEKSDSKPENIDDSEAEVSIVTADYIQQSKFSI